jgi:hypothetical protein
VNYYKEKGKHVWTMGKGIIIKRRENMFGQWDKRSMSKIT